MGKDLGFMLLLALQLCTLASASRMTLQRLPGRFLQSTACSASNPFANGPLSVTSFTIPGPRTGAPLPLTVFAPVISAGSATSAPVILFLHGFSASPGVYSQMLRQIASHGYIVIGPQFPMNFFNTDATQDITSSASLPQWLTTNYNSYKPASPPTLSPDFTKLAVSGHSRGGKVAYGVGLRLGSSPAPDVGAKAFFVLDPVDGSPFGQTRPPVVRNQANTLNLKAPSLVIGTGLGGSCAPANFNYAKFYRDTAAPAYQFRAKEYGHADMLNDGASLGCTTGRGSKDLMRRFCAGTAVAFLRSVLNGDTGCFASLVATPSQFSIVVDEVLSK